MIPSPRQDSPPVLATLAVATGIRLHPPSRAAGAYWQIESQGTKRWFKADATIAAVIAAFALPCTPNQAAARLQAIDPELDWREIVMGVSARLFGLEILTTSRTEAAPAALGLERFGWRESARYHHSSFDYTFVDYRAAAGMVEDRRRMRGYNDQNPDTDREKTVPRTGPLIAAPEQLSRLCGRFDTLLDGTDMNGGVNIDDIKLICGATFGAIGEVRYSDPRAAACFLKIIPSGGARHPTEAYVIARTISGLDPGIYHVAVRETGLEPIAGAVSRSELAAAFPGAMGRAPFEPAGLIVLTSVFARNRYRYREPRTFRSIHLDVGHAIAMVETLARHRGVRTHVQAGISDRAAERLLGLDYLREGIFSVIAIS